jgi:hypothetical protein
MTHIATISGLGLVPVGKRKVRPIPEHVKRMVPPPTDKNITIKPSGVDAERDTVPFMMNKIKRTAWQAEKLAKYLKGETLTETLRNNYDFLFNHIQYKKDPDDDEQVRSPRRLIYDGFGDCDCFTVCLGTLLINQKIPFIIRIGAYDGNTEFTHVYIVVPKPGADKSLDNRKDYMVLDPVVHQFNYEAPFTNKKDFAMKLSSLDAPPGITPNKCEVKPSPTTIRRYVQTSWVETNGLVPTAKFLRDNKIAYRDAVSEKTGGGIIVVDTANGPLQLLPVLSKSDSITALEAINAPAKSITSTPKTPITKGTAQSQKGWSPWWFVGLGVIGYALLSPSTEKQSDKS